MKIAIIGPGDVMIRWIDSQGETLVLETLTVSGSLTIEGRRTIALSIWATHCQKRSRRCSCGKAIQNSA